eukprot:g25645.t1
MRKERRRKDTRNKWSFPSGPVFLLTAAGLDTIGAARRFKNFVRLCLFWWLPFKQYLALYVDMSAPPPPPPAPPATPGLPGPSGPPPLLPLQPSATDEKKAVSTFDFSDMGRKLSKFCGIQNQGATCYLNSLVQALYMTPEVRQALFAFRPAQDPLAPELSLAHQLQRMFAYMQLSHKRSVKSQGLTRSFGWEGAEVFQQHDVQELYHVILEAFQKKYQELPLSKQIYGLYEGVSQSYVHCRTCGTRNVRKDTFIDLSLNIKGLPGVESALKDWLQPEVLDGDNQYRCGSEQCKNSKQDADKGVALLKLPPVLVLQLKRFDMDWNSGMRVKLSHQYKFPSLLDMGPFVSPVDGNKQSSTSYELTTFLMHQGGATAGHYYAYILDPESRQWFQFNDSAVTPVEKKISDSWFAEAEQSEDGPSKDGAAQQTEEEKAGAIARQGAGMRSVHTDAYLLMYRQTGHADKETPTADADPGLLPEPLRTEIEQDNQEFAIRKKEWERQADLLNVKVHIPWAPSQPSFLVLRELSRSKLSIHDLFEEIWRQCVTQNMTHGADKSDVRLVRRQDDARPGVMLPGASWPPELQQVPIAELSNETHHGGRWGLPTFCVVDLLLQRKEADGKWLEVPAGDNYLTLQARLFSLPKARQLFPSLPSFEEEQAVPPQAQRVRPSDLCQDGPAQLFHLKARNAKVCDVRAAAAALLAVPAQQVRMLLLLPSDNETTLHLNKSLDAEQLDSRKVGLMNGDTLLLETCENYETGMGPQDYGLFAILEHLNCQRTVLFKPPRQPIASKSPDESKAGPGQGESDPLQMEVDVRCSLAAFRRRLAKRLELAEDSFLIRSKSGGKECKDGSKDLAFYGIGAEPNVPVELELGRPLLPSEFRIRLFMHDPEAKTFSKLGNVIVQKSFSLAQVKADVEKLGGPPATHQRLWTKVKDRLVKLCTDDRDVQANLTPLRDGKEIAVIRTAVEETLTVDHIFVKVRQWYPEEFVLGPEQDVALLRSCTVHHAREILCKRFKPPGQKPTAATASLPSGDVSNSSSSPADPTSEHIRFSVARPFHFNDLPQICVRPWEDSSPEQEQSLALSDPPFSLKAGMFLVFKDNRVPERYKPPPHTAAAQGAPTAGGVERALKIF